MRDGSSIILNASTTTITGIEWLSVYSAASAAVRSFARSGILDLRSRKIRVNAISPGPINTPRLNGLAQTEAERKQLLEHFKTIVPLGRS